ncbi:MAG: AmmeMemoRadiSam system protein B [Piscinibacter sp.]|uniref:AmmeMemoRadiSam system protein B n=1 Tax=Piscinibacter sp. TaxID=1903157 RepID=UPI003D1253CE
MTPSTVRPAAVAGLFYPGQAAVLRTQIDGELAAVKAGSTQLPPKMLLVPHAGYVYSGPVAAHAYATLAGARGRIRRVVLLGPAHRVALRGLAAPTASAFETPLGRVAVDQAAIASLADLPQLSRRDDAHATEHSLEVQLPFLQSLLGDFTLVPLVVGHASPAEVAEVIERLWGGDETLILISSDLSHYLPYAQAQASDRATIDQVLHLDPALAHEQACGATPLGGALLAARRHGLQPRLLDLRNSGDTAGDRARVVGYAAVAFESPDPLGAALLARARNAIADALGLPTGPEPGHHALDEPGATFVTLRRGGELRGCIGTLEAQRPLAHDVRLHALGAAFRDSRFAPLAAWEFESLEIEVSLLDPSEPIAASSEAEALRALQPGVDGVVLEYRGRHATFLPQVWEQLPAPVDFLAALKRKAGLPEDFWTEALRLARYRVRKFAELRP